MVHGTDVSGLPDQTSTSMGSRQAAGDAMISDLAKLSPGKTTQKIVV